MYLYTSKYPSSLPAAYEGLYAMSNKSSSYDSSDALLIQNDEGLIFSMCVAAVEMGGGGIVLWSPTGVSRDIATVHRPHFDADCRIVGAPDRTAVAE